MKALPGHLEDLEKKGHVIPPFDPDKYLPLKTVIIILGAIIERAFTD